MKRFFTSLLCLSLFYSFAQTTNPKIKVDTVSKQIKPTLFANLGEAYPTPDGMAIDNLGNLFLAVMNLSSSETNSNKVLIFDENDSPKVWFDQLPVHSMSNKIFPMGIEFGPDGNLYIADNQKFAGLSNQSRIVRVIVENGIPKKAEVVVEGLSSSNGIRFYKNRLYLTDSGFDGEKESGIYNFSLNDLKTKIVINNLNKKDYLLAKFPIGIDGITIDNKGDLYVGNFNTGTITKIEFTKERAIKSRKIILDSELFNCSDGMIYDESRNAIFLANFKNNSVHKLNLNTNTLELIWENENNNGATGLLDAPSEPIIYKGNLIIVNFDTFKSGKNTEVDGYNTISKFKL